MSATERRFDFIVDADVAQDIRQCLHDDPDEAAVIIALIEELRGDRSLCERLIDVGFEDDDVRSVKEFAALQKQRCNAYTVRLWEVDNWRLITAVDYQQRQIALLYVMRRDENYSERVQNAVISAYERLAFRYMGK